MALPPSPMHFPSDPHFQAAREFIAFAGRENLPPENGQRENAAAGGRRSLVAKPSQLQVRAASPAPSRQPTPPAVLATPDRPPVAQTRTSEPNGGSSIPF